MGGKSEQQLARDQADKITDPVLQASFWQALSPIELQSEVETDDEPEGSSSSGNSDGGGAPLADSSSELEGGHQQATTFNATMALPALGTKRPAEAAAAQVSRHCDTPCHKVSD
jgi:hypothetical protein